MLPVAPSPLGPSKPRHRTKKGDSRCGGGAEAEIAESTPQEKGDAVGEGKDSVLEADVFGGEFDAPVNVRIAVAGDELTQGLAPTAGTLDFDGYQIVARG